MKTEILLNKYLVLKPFDNGGTANIYLVEEIKTGKKYIEKVFNNSKYYEIELNILKHLSSLNSPNIIKLISYSDEQTKIDNESNNESNDNDNDNENKKYIILDYIPNKDLLNYISFVNGLNEQETKKMFYQILKAVQ